MTCLEITRARDPQIKRAVNVADLNIAAALNMRVNRSECFACPENNAIPNFKFSVLGNSDVELIRPFSRTVLMPSVSPLKEKLSPVVIVTVPIKSLIKSV